MLSGHSDQSVTTAGKVGRGLRRDSWNERRWRARRWFSHSRASGGGYYICRRVGLPLLRSTAYTMIRRCWQRHRIWVLPGPHVPFGKCTDGKVAIDDLINPNLYHLPTDVPDAPFRVSCGLRHICMSSCVQQTSLRQIIGSRQSSSGSEHWSEHRT